MSLNALFKKLIADGYKGATGDDLGMRSFFWEEKEQPLNTWLNALLVDEVVAMPIMGRTPLDPVMTRRGVVPLEAIARSKNVRAATMSRVGDT